MKKKCTNSSCRKVFTATETVGVCCPHCGREYPRISNAVSRREVLYRVVLENPSSKLGAINVIRQFTLLPLREAKNLVVHTPSRVAEGLTLSLAREMAAAFAQCGAQATVRTQKRKTANRTAGTKAAAVSSKACKQNGVFALPQREK